MRQEPWAIYMVVAVAIVGCGLFAFFSFLGTTVNRSFVDCGWSATSVAFIDENGNAVREAAEEPLAGVQFRVDDTLNHKTDVAPEAISSVDGEAELYVRLPGCPEVDFEIYAIGPSGYTSTTPDRVSETQGSDDVYRFGFRRDD